MFTIIILARLLAITLIGILLVNKLHLLIYQKRQRESHVDVYLHREGNHAANS